MTKNRIVTEEMKRTYQKYMQRYLNDFRVFTCDATLATLLNMFYETCVVMATPVGKVASVTYLNLEPQAMHILMALNDLHTRDVHTAINTRQSTLNLLNRLGKDTFGPLCAVCGIGSFNTWNDITEFCLSTMRIKAPCEIKEKLTEILQKYSVEEMWVDQDCEDPFDSMLCPSIFLIAPGSLELAVKEIVDLYEYHDNKGTYLYASVMQYDKSTSADYFMSRAKQVYKGGDWV